MDAIVLLNGKKYVPAVLSLVNATELDEDEFPVNEPENMVAVIVLVDGLHDNPTVFCGFPYPVPLLSEKFK